MNDKSDIFRKGIIFSGNEPFRIISHNSRFLAIDDLGATIMAYSVYVYTDFIFVESTNNEPRLHFNPTQ